MREAMGRAVAAEHKLEGDVQYIIMGRFTKEETPEGGWVVRGGGRTKKRRALAGKSPSMYWRGGGARALCENLLRKKEAPHCCGAHAGTVIHIP